MLVITDDSFISGLFLASSTTDIDQPEQADAEILFALSAVGFAAIPSYLFWKDGQLLGHRAVSFVEGGSCSYSSSASTDASFELTVCVSFGLYFQHWMLLNWKCSVWTASAAHFTTVPRASNSSVSLPNLPSFSLCSVSSLFFPQPRILTLPPSFFLSLSSHFISTTTDDRFLRGPNEDTNIRAAIGAFHMWMVYNWYKYVQ